MEKKYFKQNVSKKHKQRESLKNKKYLNKKYITLIFIILILCMLIKISYAVYESNIKVSYNSTVGDMVCDISVDTNESYKVNGIPYFLVTVRNYDENGNITAMDMEYTVTIKNKDNSNGIFIWKNESDGNFIDVYSSQITTSTYSFGKDQKEETFKVFVKTANGATESRTTENVDIEVVLNAVQVAK